jgi:hypothetical protein
MNKNFIVLSFNRNENVDSFDQFSEKVSRTINQTVKSLIERFGVEDVTVHVMDETDLIKLSAPAMIAIEKKASEIVTPEEHAIVFLCSKYVKDRQFLRKKFISDILSKEKETMNAVKILGRSELSYDQLVDIVDKKMVVKLAFTRPVYEQIQLAYSFIL